ncbi:YgiW/YdeI family stress tolerance OB fold protein [Vibrio maerlii]|uniref:YgiW/YdeI family stress tolerance OB fold protein n=1 Tax=Vibrio maerlii TaxID=2231648 RepID=UPI000E3D9B08|nr:NirD/YgiW/YdeI family stress tolerance protein [Vibrio maerlii]
MKKTVIAIASTLILAPTLALAGGKHDKDHSIQYTGPIETTSVATLLEDTSMFAEVDNVAIDGQIIKQLSKDVFVFSDGSNEIQIDLDDVRLKAPLNAETKVRIFGEYEGGSTPEIEVDHIQLL